MTPHPVRPVRPSASGDASDLFLTDLMSRTVSGLYEGLLPGARLEALIDRMETRR